MAEAEHHRLVVLGLVEWSWPAVAAERLPEASAGLAAWARLQLVLVVPVRVVSAELGHLPQSVERAVSEPEVSAEQAHLQPRYLRRAWRAE